MSKTTPLLAITWIVLAATAGCTQKQTSALDSAWARTTTEPGLGIGKGTKLPTIPEGTNPKTGTVTEFWKNGTLKSERVFEEGSVKSASYFASDGTLVYEMSAE